MKEQLTSFETAKLAKEKGYKGNPPYFGFVDKFYENNRTMRSYGMHRVKNINELTYAPTQSLLQKWLREVHNIHIHISRVYEYSNKPRVFEGWCVYVDNGVENSNLKCNDFFIKNFYKFYEGALEAGLQEALKLLP